MTPKGESLLSVAKKRQRKYRVLLSEMEELDKLLDNLEARHKVHKTLERKK